MSLYSYILENRELKNLLEGGASGHMAHIIDFGDSTCEELIELVTNLFSSKIEGITEKLDGTNIQCTMNTNGEVVFIRNKGDLNSERGGMTLADMERKWESMPRVQNTFVTAGSIITQVFSKIGSSWFNPDSKTRRVINCECITEGITNIMPYAADQVDFHNIWIYTKNDLGVWENTDITKKGIEVLDKACEGIDKARLTPSVIIKTCEDSQKLIDKYTKEIESLFATRTQTIDSWKFERFIDIVNKKYSWMNDREELFDRWFNDDKSTNLKKLKTDNADHELEIDDLCKKGYKKIVQDVVEPLDKLFIKIGNDIIRLCDGLVNGPDSAKVISSLKDNLKSTIDQINKEGTDDAKEKMMYQLSRMTEDDSINATEGIVFSYKGRLCKVTGSFAALNQILGTLKFSR